MAALSSEPTASKLVVIARNATSQIVRVSGQSCCTHLNVDGHTINRAESDGSVQRLMCKSHQWLEALSFHLERHLFLLLRRCPC